MPLPVLEIVSVTKQYGALRPLRIEQLLVAATEHVAIVGLDQPAAEVLINLVTGAALPDSGHVRVFGRSTADIVNSEDWLASLDRFGIVSERAALLDSMTVLQNLAVPFSLDIDPVPAGVAEQAMALAQEVGVSAAVCDDRAGELDAAMRMRIRLGRALAFNPSLLLLEHPSASVPRHDVARFGQDVRAVAARRQLATLSITADADFARSASARTLVLEPATGRLRRR